MFSRSCLLAGLTCFLLSNAFAGPAAFTNVNISGTVFNDINGNGSQGPGEPGLQGWTVLLFGTGFSAIYSGAQRLAKIVLILGVGPRELTLQEQFQARITGDCAGFGRRSLSVHDIVQCG